MTARRAPGAAATARGSRAAATARGSRAAATARRAGARPRPGRPRAFALERATDRAVDVFWRRGYAATSVRDLCRAMGIESGSFYAAFGDKAGCFRAALARYLATQPLPRAPAPAAIRAWFEVIVDPARTPRGCLLVDAAVEAPLLDRRGRAAVRTAVAALEDFFARCLAGRGRRARGDAALLAAAVTAIHVLARAGLPAARLRAVADRALAAACIS
ncbi:MAG: TetR/AcrR family transcriptional regulator [Myxococcales bacterium]|nr:TetR/AcrR family transcriptional regulator [Myxococcales bacterium]